MKIFSNKKINKTRTISFLGIELYKLEDVKNTRVQNILGRLFVTQRACSEIKEHKSYKILGISISEKTIENDICRYYFLGILVYQYHMAELFYRKYLKKVKEKFDDVYILQSNSGEVFLFFAYLSKAFIKKNQSQNPLFIATKKYHIDILNMYYPEAKYIFINNLKLKTQSNVWEMQKHRYFIIFSDIHFAKVTKNIEDNKIGSVHYLTSMLKTLSLTKADFSNPQIMTPINSQNQLNNAINNMKLNLDNFVIIAPEAISCEDLPMSFWEKIVNELKNRCYDVFLNITKPESTIAGCKQFNLSFAEAFILAQKAKAVISLRSGFSEFLLQTGTPNIAIYTKFKNNSFSIDKGIAGFSMQKLPFVNENKVCEINAGLYNEDELVKQVLNSLETVLNKKECLL